MVAKDTLRAVQLLAVLGIVYLLYRAGSGAFNFLSNTDPTGIKDAANKTLEQLQAEATSEQDLQEMLDNLEQTGEQARDQFDESTETVKELGERKERTDGRQARIRWLREQKNDAVDKVATIEGNIEEEQAAIEQLNTQLQAGGCGTIAEDIASYQNLFGVIDFNAMDEVCNELRAQVAIHQKTIEELEKAKETWKRRVSALEDEIASLQ